MITPFDEDSVEWAIDSEVDVIKIASCSAMIDAVRENIKCEYTCSCLSGGLDLNSIDNLVSFLHRAVEFALMHCISVYPTKPKIATYLL